MNRHEQRKRAKTQRRPFPMRLPDSRPHAPEMAGALIRTLEKEWPKDDPVITETKAMALFTASAAYLAQMPDDPDRAAILSQATELLSSLTATSEQNLREVEEMETEMGGFSEDFLKGAGAKPITDKGGEPH